mmetsp:Transcript_2492/g.3944  ORF Transcript_2492/g.3944 Transcript_2492/m.3944 type:complete len:204 (-) Transcript_2492:106-717(-)
MALSLSSKNLGKRLVAEHRPQSTWKASSTTCTVLKKALPSQFLMRDAKTESSIPHPVRYSDNVEPAREAAREAAKEARRPSPPPLPPPPLPSSPPSMLARLMVRLSRTSPIRRSRSSEAARLSRPSHHPARFSYGAVFSRCLSSPINNDSLINFIFFFVSAYMYILSYRSQCLGWSWPLESVTVLMICSESAFPDPLRTSICI